MDFKYTHIFWYLIWCGDVDKYAFKIENTSSFNLKYQHLNRGFVCIYNGYLVVEKEVSNGGL